MAYRLTSGGTAAKYVTIPTCSLAGDFDITIVATQAGQTNGTFLFAGTGVAGQNGLDLYRNLSGKYQIFIDNTSSIAGTINASNNLATPDTVRVSRVSGVVTLRVNGVADGTGSNSNTLIIDRFFHRNGWAHYGNMAFYTMSITAASGNRYYDASASGGVGTSLPDTTGSQNGTLVWFSVPADWVFYSSGASGAALVSNLQADSYITANLTTQIALNSGLVNLSSLNANLSTKVQLSVQFTNESVITAILQTGAITTANIGAVATMTAALSTGIRLNSSMLNTSVLAGVLSDATPALPPQFVPVITNITQYSNSASVIYTYSGADATGYKGRINGGTPFILSESPAIIVGLLPETAYTLEIAAENAAGLGVWSIASNFTTLATSNNNELIIRNIVRPYLRPVLKEIKK